MSVLKEFHVILDAAENDLKKLVSRAERIEERTFDEWKEYMLNTFKKVRESVSKIVNGLTSKDGERLPDWVYESFDGILSGLLVYLETRLKEDPANRELLIEVAVELIKVFKQRIEAIEADKDKHEGQKE